MLKSLNISSTKLYQHSVYYSFTKVFILLIVFIYVTLILKIRISILKKKFINCLWFN